MKEDAWDDGEDGRVAIREDFVEISSSCLAMAVMIAKSNPHGTSRLLLDKRGKEEY